MTEQQIEELAIKHEDFGFGLVDNHGVSTHGFNPEGLIAFVNDLKLIWEQERNKK